MKALTAETQRRRVKEGKSTIEHCAICGCVLNREGNYASPTIQGRAHATEHHYVAERFFGRSKTRTGGQRAPLFQVCPWNLEKQHEVLCYECHEILLHNPVFTRTNILDFAGLVRQRGLNEPAKTKSQEKLAGRIRLLQEVIERGIEVLLAEKPLRLRASAVH